MKFNITGKHIDITEALKEHAVEKTAKLPRYYSCINEIEVVIEDGHGGQVGVEIIARGEHSKVFVVKEEGRDAYASIDVAVHKLQRQLTDQKEKERNNKHIAKEQQ